MDEAAHLLDFFFFDEFRGVEILDLAGNLGVEKRGIESLDAGNATADLKQRLPGFYSGVADRGQKTYARDYDSAGNKRLSFLDLHAPWFTTPGEPARTGTKKITAAAPREFPGPRIATIRTLHLFRCRELARGHRTNGYFFLLSI
jgi:hypothetical protein